MWKQALERKGIAESSLPNKVRKMIADYNEVEAGLPDLEAELASATSDEEKSDIQSDIDTVKEDLGVLGNKIYSEIQLLKANPDGTIGTLSASELEAAWNARKEQANGQHKTKSIF